MRRTASRATRWRTVDIAGQWPIWGGWSAVGRYNYSLKDHQRWRRSAVSNTTPVAGPSVWSDTRWRRFRVHQYPLFMQLELTDFARIGSNPIDLLKRNIQGYGLTNQPVADPVFGD